MRNNARFDPGETRRASVPLSECTLARAVAVIGDPWVLLILREAVYGVDRFEGMRDDLMIPRSVLTERLNRLVEAGIFERQPYRKPGHRTRHAYELTDKGRALLPALVALREWAEMHLPGGPSPLKLRHSCGGEVHARLVCERGHVIADMTEVEAAT